MPRPKLPLPPPREPPVRYRKTQITVQLPPDLLHRIDTEAARRGMARGVFLALAATEKLAKEAK